VKPSMISFSVIMGVGSPNKLRIFSHAQVQNQILIRVNMLTSHVLAGSFQVGQMQYHRFLQVCFSGSAGLFISGGPCL
jgi:hypothetical protein